MASLAVDGLMQSFGGLQAVSDVGFTVEAAGITALIGPNGAGKTTIFNMISGLLRPLAGRIVFKDRDITGWAPRRICAAGIGRTFQNLQLFGEMTVLENVIVGMHSRLSAGVWSAGLHLPSVRTEEARARHEALDLLQRFGLAEHAAKPARSLPFGSQRLLDLARALASRPGLLLLDEPAAGLNTAEARRLGQLIRGICSGGTTVLLVEHNMRLVMEVSQRVIVLNFGRKIFEGLPSDAQRAPAVIEAYLGRTRGRGVA